MPDKPKKPRALEIKYKEPKKKTVKKPKKKKAATKEQMKIIKINNKGRMPKGMITEYDPGYFITDANQSTVDDATNKAVEKYLRKKGWAFYSL